MTRLVPLVVTVRRANLRALVEAWSRAVGYAFSEADWDAIGYGVGALETCAGETWTYPLVSGAPTTLRFVRRSIGDAVRVWGDAPADAALGLEALGVILAHSDAGAPACGLLPLIERAFGDWPRPASGALLAGAPAHVAGCEECREARAQFDGQTWQARAAAGAPSFGWAGPGFLTPAARRYFLPAYLQDALERGDPERLERLLERGVAGDQWGVLQVQLLRHVLAVSRAARGVG